MCKTAFYFRWSHDYLKRMGSVRSNLIVLHNPENMRIIQNYQIYFCCRQELFKVTADRLFWASVQFVNFWVEILKSLFKKEREKGKFYKLQKFEELGRMAFLFCLPPDETKILCIHSVAWYCRTCSWRYDIIWKYSDKAWIAPIIDSDLARRWINKILAYLLLNYQHWNNTLFKGNYKILFW